jgi:L-ascorbate metabolism protein UlaG (beta-lactamase superfamily)
MAGLSVAAGAGGWWLGTSKQRSARWMRQIIADSRRAISPAPVKPEPGKWSDNAITLCWIGHATVLINFYGLKVLTDPAFGSRVGIPFGFGTAGPKRYIAPALRLKELPPVDLILLSHAHMDHMDIPSLVRLRGRPMVTARSTSDILGNKGNVRELSWGEKMLLRTKQGEMEIEAFEVKHWGERWPSKMERGYNGYILRREGKAILFGGDTALTEEFAKLRSRGPFEAAIMPIAAYQPYIRNHCTPEQAVEMANDAGAKYVVPVHHLTFKLSHEPLTEPLERLQKAFENEPERIALSRIGESKVLS